MAATADPISSQLSPPRRVEAANDAAMLPDAAMPWNNEHRRLVSNSITNGGGGGADDRGRSKIRQQPTPPPHDDDVNNDDDDRLESTLRRERSTASSTVQKLPASEIQELMSSPESLPIGPAVAMRPSFDHGKFSKQKEAIRQSLLAQPELQSRPNNGVNAGQQRQQHNQQNGRPPASGVMGARDAEFVRPSRNDKSYPGISRTVSTPPTGRLRRWEMLPNYAAVMPRSVTMSQRPTAMKLHLDDAAFEMLRLNNPAATSSGAAAGTVPPAALDTKGSSGSRAPSPMPPLIPLPPMSLPTHLQLELASQRPSPLYIHRSSTADIPYESSAVIFERLLNVILLPPYLERTLYFGALACLDAWLHTFTILPIRFVMAVTVLVRWWIYVLRKESKWLCGFVWNGIGRLWQRGRANRGRTDGKLAPNDRSRSVSCASEASRSTGADFQPDAQHGTAAHRHASSAQYREAAPGPKSGTLRHSRTKSMPSSLSSYHKADLLQGAVILCSSLALMTLDASRMYHFVRAQSAIKLYVIFNILEVSDRLLSAIGQDILECLFSAETLSRSASGRSRLLLPAGMFVLALGYNCLHSIALYYQVITLNVAVNSYSNALLTLLLSNQFVEIKSTVFKRFERDNLFQLTCADIVERFQLWIMLLIIAMRNIVEVGGLSVPGAGVGETDVDGSSGGGGGGVPLHHPSILPYSFTALPSWLWSGEVLSPFLIVVGSEMLVDTIKHAYVTKFNNIKPHFYSRTLDILCKDYYTHAFTTPSLTRRLGLAVIPLSCLFIRASTQTYHMFLATYLPMPLPPSMMGEHHQTALAEESARPSSPAIMAALNRFDALIRDSLGRATYGHHLHQQHSNNLYGGVGAARPWYAWTSDDFIAAATMVIVFFIAFLVLLILKLLLGMALLRYARARYAAMKRKEGGAVGVGESYAASGRRTGPRGGVEISDDGKRWIHADKSEGLRGGGKGGGPQPPPPPPPQPQKSATETEFHGVFRYDMVNKRIW